jgi:hypothetical protein
LLVGIKIINFKLNFPLFRLMFPNQAAINHL